jgi:hypothetical protein
MAFQLPDYHVPDFNAEPFCSAPVARREPCPADGVVPDNFHATSNLPEYVQVEPGVWVLCPESRMDGVIVVRDQELSVAAPRTTHQGDQVVVGRTENAEEGIYVHPDGFFAIDRRGEKFAFNTRRTREFPFSRDYDALYDLLRYERDYGHIVWVLGPAAAFDHDSREAMSALIEEGYCHTLMAGNALATHDLEGAVFGTALGQDIYHQGHQPQGHCNHLDLLNAARGAGSIPAVVEALHIQSGIIAACLRRNVPFVLAGSIRDDGPLPGVIGDVYEAQRQMRVYARKATTVVAVATMLHTIAFGNMLPSYQVSAGGVRPVFFYIVDVSEFATDKLANRGSMQAIGITTNAQDFLVNVRRALAPSGC